MKRTGESLSAYQSGRERIRKRDERFPRERAKTFVAPFLATRLTAPGSQRMSAYAWVALMFKNARFGPMVCTVYYSVLYATLSQWSYSNERARNTFYWSQLLIYFFLILYISNLINIHCNMYYSIFFMHRNLSNNFFFIQIANVCPSFLLLLLSLFFHRCTKRVLEYFFHASVGRKTRKRDWGTFPFKMTSHCNICLASTFQLSPSETASSKGFPKVKLRGELVRESWRQARSAEGGWWGREKVQGRFTFSPLPITPFAPSFLWTINWNIPLP